MDVDCFTHFLFNQWSWFWCHTGRGIIWRGLRRDYRTRVHQHTNKSEVEDATYRVSFQSCWLTPPPISRDHQHQMEQWTATQASVDLAKDALCCQSSMRIKRFIQIVQSSMPFIGRSSSPFQERYAQAPTKQKVPDFWCNCCCQLGSAESNGIANLLPNQISRIHREQSSSYLKG
jgi:hypothetical protein